MTDKDPALMLLTMIALSPEQYELRGGMLLAEFADNPLLSMLAIDILCNDEGQKNLPIKRIHEPHVIISPLLFEADLIDFLRPRPPRERLITDITSAVLWPELGDVVFLTDPTLKSLPENQLRNAERQVRESDAVIVHGKYIAAAALEMNPHVFIVEDYQEEKDSAGKESLRFFNGLFRAMSAACSVPLPDPFITTQRRGLRGFLRKALKP